MIKNYTEYKNIVIETNSNNNFAFIGKRVFKSSLSAKRWITKVISFCEKSGEDRTQLFYKLLVK